MLFIVLMQLSQRAQSSWLFDIFIINCTEVLCSGLKRRWIWQEMKQIRLTFCFVSEDWLLCFLLIGQLKVRFHFQSLDPLQKVISRAKLFALCCLLGGIPSPLWQSQAEGERVGNISSRFIERSINRSLLPLTL